MEIAQYSADEALFRIKINKNCIKMRKNYKVQKDVKNASKF